MFYNSQMDNTQEYKEIPQTKEYHIKSIVQHFPGIKRINPY